jgi:hypothetical protein
MAKKNIINKDIGMELMMGSQSKKEKKKISKYPLNRFTTNIHKYMNKSK